MRELTASGYYSFFAYRMLIVEHLCTSFTTTVRWKIENFSDVASRDDPEKKFLLSEEFSLFKSRLRFYLRFYPINLTERGNKDYSSIYLRPQDLDNEKSVKLNVKFWVENTSKRRIGDKRGID